MLEDKFKRVLIYGLIGALLGLIWSFVGKKPDLYLWLMAGFIIGVYQGTRSLGFSWKRDKFHHKIFIIITFFSIIAGIISFIVFGKQGPYVICSAYLLFQIFLFAKIIKNL